MRTTIMVKYGFMNLPLSIIDESAKSRHSRENGNPGGFQLPEKTGFLLAQE
jgi:hypothetical protein